MSKEISIEKIEGGYLVICGTKRLMTSLDDVFALVLDYFEERCETPRDDNNYGKVVILRQKNVDPAVFNTAKLSAKDLKKHTVVDTVVFNAHSATDKFKEKEESHEKV